MNRRQKMSFRAVFAHQNPEQRTLQPTLRRIAAVVALAVCAKEVLDPCDVVIELVRADLVFD